MAESEARRGKFISFDDNGEAIIGGVNVAAAKSFSKRQLNNLTAAALSLPYKPKVDPVTREPLPGEEYYEGMSCGEAMYVRVAHMAAWGDLEAAKIVMDRTMGKPKQEVEILGTIELSCTDYLEQLAQIEQGQQIAGLITDTVVDVSLVETHNKLKDLGV